MPNDSQSRPPTLDYQPVTKGRRRIPTWLIFVVGFGVGILWPLVLRAFFAHLPSRSRWILLTVYPGSVVFDFVHRGSQLWWLAELLAFFTVGISYGLLALLGYAVHRGLLRRHGGSDSKPL